MSYPLNLLAFSRFFEAVSTSFSISIACLDSSRLIDSLSPQWGHTNAEALSNSEMVVGINCPHCGHFSPGVCCGIFQKYK